MPMPPKSVPETELWRKLSQRPRPSTVVDFPARRGEESPGKLALRVLTESELDYCRGAAETVAKEFCGKEGKAGDLGYEDVYRQELALQLICFAARDPADNDVPIFPLPKHARQKLTTDELAQLVQSYHYFRAESGPLLYELTADEMEAWIQVLVKGGSRVPLARCSGEALTDLVMFLVSKLGNSPTDSGSAGSPPGESSTPTPPSPPKGEELVDREELGPKP